VTIGSVDRKAGKFVRGAENSNDFAKGLTHYRFYTRHKVISTALGPVNSTLSLENSYHVLKTDPELINRVFTVFGSAIQPRSPLDRSDATHMAGTITIDEAKQYGCERFEFVFDAAARVVHPARPPVINEFGVLMNRPVDFLPSHDLSHGLTGVRLVRNELLVYLSTIPITDPSVYCGAVPRQRRVVAAQDRTPSIGDHDFVRFQLTPSLHFLVDTPESGMQYEDVSFYHGTPTVILKNQLFEPSSAMRHAVEELNTIEMLEHRVKEIMVKYTDGGPDHRTNFITVIIGDIAQWLFGDLTFSSTSGRRPDCQLGIRPNA
jgi:hypothetical protein